MADTQEFCILPDDLRIMSQFTATVHVRLKNGVLDPEAKTTQRALERLDFELDNLRFSDQYEIDLEAETEEAAHERVTEMTERLLANPTIHDYDIEITEL